MTTQINDIHDLLRLLEERPDLAAELRQRTLTPELLAMPEQMATLTLRVDGLAVRVDALAEQMAALTVRVDALAEQMAALTARVDALTAQMATLTARVDGLTERVDGLTEQMAALTARVDELSRELREINRRTDERLARLEELQAQTNERLARLEELQIQGNERLARLEELQAQTNERLARLENRVGDLSGAWYEERCLRRIPSLVFNEFGLVNTAVLFGGFNPPEQQFQGRLLAARREGKISDDDFRQLMAADCLAYAWDAEAEAARYLAVEMSVTLDQGDIERARERAAALGRVTAGSGWGVVISANVAEPQGRQAQDAGVTVIHFTGDK